MSEGASRISLFEDDHEIKAYRLSELLGSVRRALEASFKGYYRIVAVSYTHLTLPTILLV